jgi:hypothetical protein
MKRCCWIILFLTALAVCRLPVSATPPDEAQNFAELKKSAAKVFIDWERTDLDYIRTEIPFVNYVRDRKEADVHVMVTTQNTGSGGTEYTFAFIGLGRFADTQSTLVYASQKTDTPEEVRRGYVRILKMGLLPFAAKSPIRDVIDISFAGNVKPTDVTDGWKFWVFSFSLSGRIRGESQAKSNSLFANFSANKVTPDIKLRLGFSANVENEEYIYEEETIRGRSEGGEFQGLFVKSISDHWSVGAFLGVSTSTFANIRVKVTPTPAVEYNLFRYSESTRRQLRFLYKVGYEFARYRQETIFDKIQDRLLGESLSATFEIKEPWGSLQSSLEGSHYFHDFSKNRMIFSTELSFRIFKGLNISLDGRYERVRDQLSLSKGDASLEDILMSQRQLATNHEYFLSVSLSYTFGSIFSNVVNPRFGNSYHMGGGWGN